MVIDLTKPLDNITGGKYYRGARTGIVEDDAPKAQISDPVKTPVGSRPKPSQSVNAPKIINGKRADAINLDLSAQPLGIQSQAPTQNPPGYEINSSVRNHGMSRNNKLLLILFFAIILIFFFLHGKCFWAPRKCL